MQEQAGKISAFEGGKPVSQTAKNYWQSCDVSNSRGLLFAIHGVFQRGLLLDHTGPAAPNRGYFFSRTKAFWFSPSAFIASPG
jgi:hypothetical protein